MVLAHHMPTVSVERSVLLRHILGSTDSLALWTVLRRGMDGVRMISIILWHVGEKHMDIARVTGRCDLASTS